MSDFSSEPAPGNSVTRPLLEQLRRHPKRVVFTEGEDIRVIQAAARLVAEEAVAPILLGNRERIRALAVANEVIWRSFSTETWVTFKTFGLTAALFLFFMTQGKLLQKYGIETKKD